LFYAVLTNSKTVTRFVVLPQILSDFLVRSNKKCGIEEFSIPGTSFVGDLIELSFSFTAIPSLLRRKPSGYLKKNAGFLFSISVSGTVQEGSFATGSTVSGFYNS